jgi:hypothetical protein
MGYVGVGEAAKLLRSDPSHGELCLDEAEPDRWFCLIVGRQFHLGSCSCRGGFLTDLLIHEVGDLVDGCCPGGGKWVPQGDGRNWYATAK